MYDYKFNLEKLIEDIKTKQNKTPKLSYYRISRRLGVSESTISSLVTRGLNIQKGVRLSVLMPILDWLNKPFEDYVIKTEKDNLNGSD